jgi:hypothetical protein
MFPERLEEALECLEKDSKDQGIKELIKSIENKLMQRGG